ncbi:hypothetical protein ScPMuIL_010221 [Solemya velum]
MASLSRYLAKLLRHDAPACGFDISEEGYVDVAEILEEKPQYTEADVRKVVNNDRKGRFHLRTHHGRLEIKATQGHSIQLEKPDLTPITHFTEARTVLHGTSSSRWNAIKNEGLSRMRRTHIHFTTSESGARSGFPRGCDIAIEINMEKALRAGIKFYTSENEVILSPGNSDGLILPKYFKSAYNLRTRQQLQI